jgi:hypothetical protein
LWIEVSFLWCAEATILELPCLPFSPAEVALIFKIFSLSAFGIFIYLFIYLFYFFAIDDLVTKLEACLTSGLIVAGFRSLCLQDIASV